MTDVPETRYARNGAVHIAYQVVSDGPFDLVGIPPMAQNIQACWESPRFTQMLRGLGSFCRYIHMDKRGTGMSDAIAGAPTLEDRMDDVLAVMDAVGSGRAAMLGESEGGPMSILLAATFPERTSALVLYGTFPCTTAPDYPWAASPEVVEQFVQGWVDVWGTHDSFTLSLLGPSALDDAAFGRWWPGYERQAASPGALGALLRSSAQIDVRPILPSITVPTLVLHRTGDQMVSVENARYLANAIPGATLLELPGNDHFPFCGDIDAWVDAIAEFLTGTRGVHQPDRLLTTILFTDVVDSTKQAATLGDSAWRRVLDEHDALTSRLVETWRGRLVKTTGDGALATFDGPARAIGCASAVVAGAQGIGIEVRAGLHTGEVEVRGDDVGGIAVHTGARVAALAGPGQVLVSRTVADLVAGSNIRFSDQGEHDLKGVPGPWRIFLVEADG